MPNGFYEYYEITVSCPRCNEKHKMIYAAVISLGDPVNFFCLTSDECSEGKVLEYNKISLPLFPAIVDPEKQNEDSK